MGTHGLSRTLSVTGGDLISSLRSTPTPPRTSPSPRSTRSCSWCSSRRRLTSRCRGTTSSSRRRCSSCTTTRRDTGLSSRLSRRRWEDSTLFTCSVCVCVCVQICSVQLVYVQLNLSVYKQNLCFLHVSRLD